MIRQSKDAQYGEFMMKQWMAWPLMALIITGCGGTQTDPAQIAKQQAQEAADKEAEIKAQKQKQIEAFVKNNAKNLAAFAMKFAKSDNLTKEIQTLVTSSPKQKTKTNGAQIKFMQPADIQAIYEGRQFAPIFVTDSALDPAAEPLFKELRHLDAHGLGSKLDIQPWLDAQNALQEIQSGIPHETFTFTPEEEAYIVDLIIERNLNVTDPDAIQNLVLELVKDETHMPRLHQAVASRAQAMATTARQSALLEVLTTDIAMRFAREMAFDNLSHLTEDETASLGKRPTDKKYRAISANRTKTWLTTLAAVLDAPAPGLKKDVEKGQKTPSDALSDSEDEGTAPSELTGTAKADINAESEDAKDAHVAETQAADAQKAKLQNAQTVQELVDNLYPAHAQYKLLMEIRNRYASIQSWPKVKQTKLRRNKPSPVVPDLKRRLAMEGYYHGDVSEQATLQEGFDIYDDDLRAAVRYYHETHQLEMDEEKGIQKSFWTSLNTPVEKRLAQIDENLRRWHKTQITESPYYIYINVPDFHGEIWREGKLAYRFPIVVGNAKRQCDPTTKTWKYINATPLMHARMLYVEYNPYWNVPPRIEQEDYIEKINADPTWLEREGFEYFTENGHTVLRQLPAEDNALGRVKFIFPNPHSTFLHDSPQKGLFRYPIRAFSHGCMRVWEPLELAKRILQYDGQWYDALATEIEDMVTRRIVLKTRFDVFIDYFTVRVDDDGNAHFLADPYRYVRYALEPPKPESLECVPEPKAWIPRAALGGGVGAEAAPADELAAP